MKKTRQAQIDAALQRLADMMPYGNMQSSMDPAGFLNSIADRLEEASKAQKKYEADKRGRPL